MRDVTLAALGALLLPCSTALAQMGAVDRLGPATRSGEPRFMGGASLTVAQPIGDFADYVANGVGVAGHGIFRLGGAGAFALRLDGGFVNYGRERKTVPLTTTIGRVRVDVTTQNNIFWLGAGPQLMVPRGPVRPYINGTAGFAYFATTSGIEDRQTNERIIDDTNYDDLAFSYGGGGGVLVPVARNARTLFMIDLGARVHDNGRNVRYLREGGIRDLPGGRIELDVIESRANLITYHIGISVGAR
jgi:hypothetical protein